jgi:hypothetical protein
VADQEDRQHAGEEDQRAVYTDRIVAARKAQQQAADGHRKADQDGLLSFVKGELRDHGRPARIRIWLWLAHDPTSTWAPARSTLCRDLAA